ncbi:MAG: TlpA disulfide reductase family protein [Candidatus Sulfopaludibacter sp.]|nr:TlpA disulfide reductase family protein [Candidatus Sulfopaludibacter sp.]
MRILFALAVTAVLAAQNDPAVDAYRTWDATQHGVDSRARAQRLLEVSAEWVAKWPNSDFAWVERREALVSLTAGMNVSTVPRGAELWKQVDENIMRLRPPHMFAASAAYDWVTAGVNVEAAEKLLLDEIAWQDGQPRQVPKASPTLADLVDQAQFTGSRFVMLYTLAWAQIHLKQFDQARATIESVQSWLEGDFRLHYDTDPLEAFPDYEAKYFQLSADLAMAEGRKVDALAFYHAYLANPYYRRGYGAPGPMNSLNRLWKEIGGSDAGWTAFSAVPPLPPDVPVGRRGGRFPSWANVTYFPWVKVDYKLPPLQIADLMGRTWTNRDFQEKTTIVYLWSSLCSPCWPALNAVQILADEVKGRPDVQVVTLSVDQDRDKLVVFMQQKGYTFPVLASKPYVQTVLPQYLVGQFWIVDGSGSVRLQRGRSDIFAGNEEAHVQELLYKARQFWK